MIFDTHAHYDDEAFDEDREALLRSMPGSGVTGIVNMGASLEGARKSAALAEQFDYVYAGIGLHPDDAGRLCHLAAAQSEETAEPGRQTASQINPRSTDRTLKPRDSISEDLGAPQVEFDQAVLEELRSLCRQKKTVAVGEIGLDYHWDIEPRAVQQAAFVRQMELARELDLPINVHSRDAAQDTFDLIRAHHAGTSGGIIHCYSGSLEMAREYVKMGYYLGIGGVVTFKNSKVLQRVVAQIPVRYLVTETDCPYLAPTPHRGERNDSRNIAYVIEKIAQLKEMEKERLEEILYENALRAYRL